MYLHISQVMDQWMFKQFVYQSIGLKQYNTQIVYSILNFAKLTNDFSCALSHDTKHNSLIWNTRKYILSHFCGLYRYNNCKYTWGIWNLDFFWQYTAFFYVCVYVYVSKPNNMILKNITNPKYFLLSKTLPSYANLKLCKSVKIFFPKVQ